VTGASNGATEQLRRTVGDLRRVTTAAGHDRLGPGVAQETIRDAQRALAPYRLPTDLVTLYEEANGWDEFVGEYTPLAWDLSFMTLDSAIETYKAWLSIDIDIWNPVWFPAFAPQSGEFVTLQLADEASIDTVWGFHTHDVNVWSAYDSVATMFAMVLAGWSARLDLDDGAQWRRLAAQFNPRSLHPEGGASRIVLRRSSAAGWPAPWCRAIGDPDLRPVGGPYEPIAAVLAGNSSPPVLIHGYSRGIAGGWDWATVAVIDDTAETRVLLTAALTENFREYEGGSRFEMLVRPTNTTNPVPGAEEPTSRFAGSLEALRIARL
jgi:hypothetical protein